MTTRERLRTKLRRRAEYLIQSGAAERRPMTDEERKFFLDSIEQNAPNEFGLVKLSELQVDEALPEVVERCRLWDAQRDIGLEGPQTMLTYAAWLGRAWIVRALLRAGADPAVRGQEGNAAPSPPSADEDCEDEDDDEDDSGGGGHGEEGEEDDGEEEEEDGAEDGAEETAWTTPKSLMTMMMTQYPEAATWTVMAMVRMRAAAGSQLSANKRRLALEENNRQHPLPATTTMTTTKRRGAGGKYPPSSSSCVHCGSFPKMPVSYVTCHHVACEPCAWRHLAAMHGELRCPGAAAAGGGAGMGMGHRSRKREDGGGGGEGDGGGGGGGVAEDGEWCGGGVCCVSSSWREGAPPSLGDRDLPFDSAAARMMREASLRAWAALPVDGPAAAAAAVATGAGAESAAGAGAGSAAAGAPPPPPLPRVDPILGGRFLALKGAKKTFLPEPPAIAAARRVAKIHTRSDRDRALLAASSLGDVPTIRALVAVGADVECRDENGFTPLVFASWRGRAGAARALLHAGADHSAAAAGGATATAVAAANGHSPVLRELRHAGGAGTGAARSPRSPRSPRFPAGGAAVEIPPPPPPPPPLPSPSAPTPPPPTDRRARAARRTTPTTAAAAGGDVQRQPRLPPTVTRLAAPAEVVAQVLSGVGAMYVDGGVSDEFMGRVDSLMDTMTGAKGTRGACTDAERLFYTDAQGWVRAGLTLALEAAAAGAGAGAGAGTGAGAAAAGAAAAGAAAAGAAAAGIGAADAADAADAGGGLGFTAARVLPHMRFLRYTQPGGRLAPHVDLRKVDEETGERSTHTFCLYMATCAAGGETVIMDKIGEPTDPMSDRVGVLSECAPARGGVVQSGALFDPRELERRPVSNS